jgi:Ras-related protein Rab-11A
MSKDEDITIEEVVNPESKEDFKLKIVVVGDSGVGKTNLIKRFITNEFSENFKATIGVEFMSKTYKINKHLFKIEIWDTAGQERYKSITTAYYKGAKGAMIIYDVTNQNSFNNVDKWFNEIKDKASKNINLIMIGNKTDLDDKKVVSSEDSLDKAKNFDIPVMETSALNASNVKEAFYLILKEMYKSVKSMMQENEKKDGVDTAGVQLDTNNENKGKKKKKCC